MRPFLSLTLLAALSLPLSAQDWPVGWESRLDRAGADPNEISFVTMEPGWHVTTGPAAILYHPDMTASGDFRLEAEIFMFDPQGRREAFGIFVGGSDLQGDGQIYTYFLLRDGSQFLVKRRQGAETSDVVGWTSHDAIKSFDDRGEEPSVKNVLALEVEGDACRFYVNGEEVASAPRADLALDGVVGLRVNHRVNIHVSGLEVETGGGDR